VCGANDHGRLRLDASLTAPVSFGVTRRGARVGIAVTEGRAVGVDVEVAEDPDDPQRAALAAEVLCPAELVAYRRLPAATRSRAVGRWWTRKEAVLKATGDGLAVPPARLHVSGPDAPAALLAWFDPSPTTGHRPAVRSTTSRLVTATSVASRCSAAAPSGCASSTVTRSCGGVVGRTSPCADGEARWWPRSAVLRALPRAQLPTAVTEKSPS
jgi:4'-phosphopantetheinyl transferase